MTTLTPQMKAHIDSLSYEGLLRGWRNAAVGDPRFQGEAGDYWALRMAQLRDGGADHVGASKRIGWDGGRS